MIRFLFLALLAVCAPAFAAVSNVAPAAVRSGASSFVVSAASDGTPIASAARSVVAGSASGEFLIRDMFTATGPAGSLPLTATRTVSGIGAARAIVGQAAKGFTPVAIGLAAYDLMQAYRMREAGGFLEQDIGIEGADIVVTEYKSGDGSWSGNSNASAESYAAYINTNGQQGTYTYPDGTTKPNVAKGRSVNDPYWGLRYVVDVMKSDGSLLQANFRQGGISTRSMTKRGCTEAATGVFTLAGADGKCPTGRYESVTQEQAATKLSPAVTAPVIRDYVNSPASKDKPVEESKPMTVTGPAEQVGPPRTTTKTGPTGTVSETITPTYQYNYGGNTITYNTVNQTVTNVTNNEGDTTTETETKPETPKEGDCELYPNSVGCLELGEVPEEEVPEEEREVEIEPEAVDLPSGCPADVALPGGRVLSYASACAAAEDVAPLVIAAGVLSALLIAVAAIRGS